MVSVERAEKYATLFFKVMPKRLKLLLQLRREKVRLDDKIKRNRYNNFDIFDLMRLLGRDFLFRKAENRNKPTLRHLIAKITKSLKIFYRKFGDDARIRVFGTQSSDSLSKDIVNLKQFLLSLEPHAIKALENLDEIYQQQYNLLEQAWKDNTAALNSYLNLVQTETSGRANELIGKIREVNLGFINLARELRGGLNKQLVTALKGRLSTEESGNLKRYAEFFWIAVSCSLMGVAAALIVPPGALGEYDKFVPITFAITTFLSAATYIFRIAKIYQNALFEKIIVSYFAAAG
ncbi:hypothetical protein HYX02_04365 [Candidatus Woesearchaeota archaeon]|nr:hypothetical protein [Candidatus Woesearchaeota archaeon]